MSNEEKPQQENMLQIEISPEVAQGTYANLAMIAPSIFLCSVAEGGPQTALSDILRRMRH